MPGTYPNLLAGGITDEGSLYPFELFAGESDVVTSQGTAGTTALEQFRVISRVSGLLVPWDGTTLSGAGKPIGITAQPIPAGATGPFFIGGVFAHDALVWPSGVTTVVARKAAFDGSNIAIGTILGVATRAVYP